VINFLTGENSYFFLKNVLRKAVFAFLFLLIPYFFNFSFLSVLFFLLFNIFLYFSLHPGREKILFSFWITNFLGLFFVYNGGFEFNILFIFAIYFMLMLFEIGFALGFFEDSRGRFYIFLNTLLFVFILLVFFSSGIQFQKISFGRIFFKLNFLFWPIFLASLEFWKNMGSGLRQREKFWSLLLSLLALEISSIFMFLPVDFYNGVVFVSLFLLFARSIYISFESGALGINFVFKNAIALIIFGVIIMFLTNWFLGNF
jgi:hypothetical protein